MASRGADLDSVLVVTATNGATIGLQRGGGVVASEIHVQGGVPMIRDQTATAGYSGMSRVGPLGAQATALSGQGLSDGKTYYVVEVFAPYQPFTPLDALVKAVVPDTLYDRTVF